MQKDSDALKLSRYKEIEEKLLTKENVTSNRSSVNACEEPYWRCLIQFLDSIFNTNTTARQFSICILLMLLTSEKETVLLHLS